MENASIKAGRANGKKNINERKGRGPLNQTDADEREGERVAAKERSCFWRKLRIIGRVEGSVGEEEERTNRLGKKEGPCRSAGRDVDRRARARRRRAVGRWWWWRVGGKGAGAGRVSANFDRRRVRRRGQERREEIPLRLYLLKTSWRARALVRNQREAGREGASNQFAVKSKKSIRGSARSSLISGLSSCLPASTRLAARFDIAPGRPFPCSLPPPGIGSDALRAYLHLHLVLFAPPIGRLMPSHCRRGSFPSSPLSTRGPHLQGQGLVLQAGCGGARHNSALGLSTDDSVSSARAQAMPTLEFCLAPNPLLGARSNAE